MTTAQGGGKVEPATFRFVAQYLNHCATAVSCSCNVYALNPRWNLVFFSPARGSQVVKMASAQENVIMCSAVFEGRFSEACVACNFCGSYRTDSP